MRRAGEGRRERERKMAARRRVRVERREIRVVVEIREMGEMGEIGKIGKIGKIGVVVSVGPCVVVVIVGGVKMTQ